MTYKVKIFEVHCTEVEVHADTEDNAKNAAKKLVETGQYMDMGELEFSHVMDSKLWGVRRKNA